MTDFAFLEAAADWQPDFRQRLIGAYRTTGLPEPAAGELAAKAMEQDGGWTAAAVLDDEGRRIGQVVVGLTERHGRRTGRIGELWTDPAHDGQGSHRRAAHAWARRWCAERGAGEMFVRPAAPDEVFAGYPVRAQTRIKDVTAPAEPPADVTYRPMAEEEYPAWLAAGKQSYAADMERARSWTPEQAARKADEDFDTLLPEGPATPLNTLLTLEAGGEPIGSGWLRHGYLPGVSYGYSLEVHPQFRGRGHGRSAMAIGEQVTRAAGDRFLMFNVFGGNEVAMSLYTAVGYRVLEENRSCELTPGAE